MRLLVIIFSVFFLLSCGTGNNAINGQGECFGYDRPQDSQYVLPYRVGESWRVTQGNCIAGGSHNQLNRFSYDFNFPQDWPVTATRGGEVTALDESNADSDDAPTPNFVEITHKDETISRYQYLAQNGVLVELGDTITQGQLIALAGSSSVSNPLLHFETFRLVNGSRETLPVTFRNTKHNPGGLIDGESYTAEAFTPDER